MFNQFYAELNKGTKMMTNLFDLNMAVSSELLNKGMQDFTEINDLVLKQSKTVIDSKTPEVAYQNQVNFGKEFGSKVQKLSEENMAWVKSTGSKYGEIVESFNSEIKKAAK